MSNLFPNEYRKVILEKYHKGEIDKQEFYKLYSKPPLRKPIPKAKRLEVFNKYQGHCAYCGCEITLKEMQVDHFLPFETNGDNQDISNLMPSCRQCNYYKSTLSLERFREELGHLLERIDKQLFIYRLAKKYDLVKETPKQIKFYFEKGELKLL